MLRHARALTCTALIASSAFGFGNEGHQIVGAIADKRLAQHPEKAKAIGKLLDGLTLEEAATIPDQLKKFDNNPDGFKLAGHKELESQLREFLKANPARGHDKPNHHEFHYTDVSIVGNHDYVEGEKGTSNLDIVHMIPYCIKVLDGSQSEDNPHKITKPIAAILLAHYVGDIHQPLHVGAMFFDQSGDPADPNKTQAFGDQGGGKIMLTLERPRELTIGLHEYWDNNAVRTAVQTWKKTIQKATDHSALTHEELGAYLATHEPSDWKNGMSGSPSECAKAWANEILPIARKAHSKLEFSQATINSHSHLAECTATEASQSGTSYAKWAGKTTQHEIHMAGWRLAELLETVVH